MRINFSGSMLQTINSNDCRGKQHRGLIIEESTNEGRIQISDLLQGKEQYCTTPSVQLQKYSHQNTTALCRITPVSII